MASYHNVLLWLTENVTFTLIIWIFSRAILTVLTLNKHHIDHLSIPYFDSADIPCYQHRRVATQLHVSVAFLYWRATRISPTVVLLLLPRRVHLISHLNGNVLMYIAEDIRDAERMYFLLGFSYRQTAEHIPMDHLHARAERFQLPVESILQETTTRRSCWRDGLSSRLPAVSLSFFTQASEYAEPSSTGATKAAVRLACEHSLEKTQQCLRRIRTAKPRGRHC